MKKIYVIIFMLISFISIIECKNEKSNQPFNPDLKKSQYDSLTDFKWLFSRKNYKNKNFDKIFEKRYEESLKKNNYENAAAYLIVYGEKLIQQFQSDSIYLKNTIEFYNRYKNKISNNAKSQICYYIGVQYQNINNFNETKDWLLRCTEFPTESIEQKQIQGFAYFSVGQYFLYNNNDLESTENYLIKALKIFDEINDGNNKGTVYLLMHNLYKQNKIYDKAEESLKKSLKIFKDYRDSSKIVSGNIALIDLYIDLKDTIQIIKTIDNTINFAKSYKNISDYQIGSLNQYKSFKSILNSEQDSAMHYFQISKNITERTNNPYLKSKNSLLAVFLSQKFKTQIENIEETESLFKELSENKEENKNDLKSIGEQLYIFYQKKGQYKKANEYAEFLIENANKDAEDRVKGNLFELEKKFETEQKEKTILLQEKALTDKNKIIFCLLTISVIIVLLFIILLVWNKNKSILKEKKITENYAAQLLQKTENERKRIASDLHDSVSNELVNLRHAIKQNNSTLKNKIDSILEEIRSISRNISPTLFDKIGLKLSIEQLIERTQNQHNFFISSEIDYNNSLDHDKELQLYRIIQEAITNIIKHSNAVAGKIIIKELPTTLNVEIKDNGKGFDVEKMLQKGNCFGLLNITERTKYLNGTVNFHSNNAGTLIQIEIKK